MHLLGASFSCISLSLPSKVGEGLLVSFHSTLGVTVLSGSHWKLPGDWRTVARGERLFTQNWVKGLAGWEDFGGCGVRMRAREAGRSQGLSESLSLAAISILSLFVCRSICRLLCPKPVKAAVMNSIPKPIYGFLLHVHISAHVDFFLLPAFLHTGHRHLPWHISSLHKPTLYSSPLLS